MEVKVASYLLFIALLAKIETLFCCISLKCALSVKSLILNISRNYIFFNLTFFNVKLYHLDHSVLFKFILNVSISKYVGKYASLHWVS